MSLFTDEERKRSETLIRLSYCNPFMPERIRYERELLGSAFVDPGVTWHKNGDSELPRPNVDRLAAQTEELAKALRARLIKDTSVSEAERRVYEDVVLYFVYNKYKADFFDYLMQESPPQGHVSKPVNFYSRYQDDLTHYLVINGVSLPPMKDADHLFACFFQLRHAFHHIFENIIGGSDASARLRAAVWQSIFTCDMQRYRRSLYKRMGDITTLITGPSGTGKELVARAIGLSRYVPFDSRSKRFVADLGKSFLPINLTALSPTLIESELFGHAKGAFTGAVADHVGFLETCPSYGSVFLDEIGDLDLSIQVKLLRVLQMRVFQRIGETADRRFNGKVITATNRDLHREMADGRFREDLYYRLCSDIIQTPSLRDQIQHSPEQLRNLLWFICRRVAGEHEADSLASEVEGWIKRNIPEDYAWPGNVRELEQCVRNILVRCDYRPARRDGSGGRFTFLDEARAGQFTAAELLRHYCTLVYAQTGSYQAAAARLQLDRRTVKGHVYMDRVSEYRTVFGAAASKSEA